MVRLRAENLRFSYNDKLVLRDVSFSLESGEVLGLVGPNGSGKTTLIKCLSQILKPEGSVFLEEYDLKKMKRQEIAKKIAYVPQYSSKGSSTVFETILMGRRPYLTWSVSQEDEERVAETMTLLGIEEFAFRQVSELSGGERQRVMIARALVQETGVILLDEPTSSLDLHHQMGVMSLVMRLAEERGLSVIVSIHDLNLAARYCHRLLVLREGSVMGCGSPVNLLTSEMVQEVYGIEALVKTEAGIPYIVPVKPVE